MLAICNTQYGVEGNLNPASVRPSAALSSFARGSSDLHTLPPPEPYQAEPVEQLRLELHKRRGNVDLLAVDTSGQERRIRTLENDIQTLQADWPEDGLHYWYDNDVSDKDNAQDVGTGRQVQPVHLATPVLSSKFRPWRGPKDICSSTSTSVGPAS